MERYDTTLRVKETDRTEIVVPTRLRERHLTPESEGETVCVQAIGRHLMITIPSYRDHIEIRIPFTEWTTTEGFSRSFWQGRIAVTRWRDVLPVEDGRVDAKIRVIPDDWNYALL